MCKQMPQLRKKKILLGRITLITLISHSCKECVKIKITAAKSKHSDGAAQFTDLNDEQSSCKHSRENLEILQSGNI